MGFIKNRIIYESEKVRVEINECHAKGRKTRIFAVRRDDKTGLGEFLGSIEWDGAWWQYVFIPGESTKWSAGCMRGICEFLGEINKKQRAKWKK